MEIYTAIYCQLYNNHYLFWLITYVLIMFVAFFAYQTD
jgi:hypothetical protein